MGTYLRSYTTFGFDIHYRRVACFTSNVETICYDICITYHTLKLIGNCYIHAQYASLIAVRPFD